MSSSLSHSTQTPEEPFSRAQLEHPCRLQLTWAREDCSSPPTSPGDARGALGRDSPQKKPDLGRSRTKNNLPAAQEERRAKHIQIIHMSGGESSASIFRDNRGEHGVWCNSVWNSGTAALKSLQAFLGQQSSRRSIPPGSCPPSGDELPCLVPGSDREPQCSCAKEKRPPAQPLLPQEAAAAAARAAGSPKNLETWEGVLPPSITPAAITQKSSPSLSRGEQRLERVGEAGKKI